MTDYNAYLSENGPTDAAADDAPYTMGLEFDVSSPVWLKSINFWQPSGNSPSSAVRKALLYRVTDASNGVLLLGPSDFPATVPNWNAFNPGVGFYPALTAGNVYRACVHHPLGRYPADANYYSAGAGTPPKVVGPLRIADAALATGGHQNSFIQNAVAQFPNTAFNSARYWISVTVTDVNPNIVSSESLADEARRLMLQALAQAESNKSNVDLMREVIAAGGLGIIVPTSETAAVQYWRYLKVVRDN